MDGINVITVGYAYAMLLPMLLLNRNMMRGLIWWLPSLDAGFSFFNFRHKEKTRYLADNVRNTGIAFVILYALGWLLLATK